MKKALVILSLAFLLFSCDTGASGGKMENQAKANPFVGAWETYIIEGTVVVSSFIQFFDKTFTYYVIHYDLTNKDENNNLAELSRKVYKGNYSYNENSSVIFFDIKEPSSEAGVTSSSYQFYGDKLYCFGNKFLITEKLHEKVDISQYSQN